MASAALEASAMSPTDRQASAPRENKETSRCAGHCGPTLLSSSGKGREREDKCGKCQTYPLVSQVFPVSGPTAPMKEYVNESVKESVNTDMV